MPSPMPARRAATTALRLSFCIGLAGLLAALLTACGGSGGTGNPLVEEPEINDLNAADLGVAAASAASSAVASDDLPSPGGPIVSTGSGAEAAQAALFDRLVSGEPPNGGPGTIDAGAFFEQMDELEAEVEGGSVDPFCPLGGSSMMTTQGNTTTTTYTACRPITGVEWNGAIVGITNFTTTTYTSTVAYDEFCVTLLDFAETRCFDGNATTITCVNINDAQSIECFESSSAAGLDGRTYEIYEPDVSGNDVSGYQVSAEVEDPDWGRIGFVTSEPIFFECNNGAPSDGLIAYFGAGSTQASIEFLDCDTFEICIGLDCDEYDWVDFGLPLEPQ